MRPYKLADLGYVLIRIVEHMRRHIMGRTHFHRSEFMELKILFILPYSFLSKKYRTRIFDFYCQSCHSENRAKNNKSSKRKHNVNASLYVSFVEAWPMVAITYSLEMTSYAVSIFLIILVFHKNDLFTLKRIFLLRLIIINSISFFTL